jgi:hypothetical protein
MRSTRSQDGGRGTCFCLGRLEDPPNMRKDKEEQILGSALFLLYLARSPDLQCKQSTQSGQDTNGRLPTSAFPELVY